MRPRHSKSLTGSKPPSKKLDFNPGQFTPKVKLVLLHKLHFLIEYPPTHDGTYFLASYKTALLPHQWSFVLSHTKSTHQLFPLGKI
jgi:hypothetical protein